MVLQLPLEAHPERFVRGVSLPPALPEATWNNLPPHALREKKLLR